MIIFLSKLLADNRFDLNNVKGFWTYLCIIGGIALLIRPAFAVVARILGDTLGKYDSLITSLGAPLLNGFVMIGLIFVCAGAAMIIINIIVSLITKLVAKIKAKRA